MRRRYSDFEWLKNELERDSKVRPWLRSTRTCGNSLGCDLELSRREAVVVGSSWGLISVHVMGLEMSVKQQRAPACRWLFY